MPVGVLFVCTGNICRSPTAEGVFRHLVVAAGLTKEINVDSAGTEGFHIGEPPDARAVAAAKARGYDMSGQAARRVSEQDFHRFDVVVAMDKGHLRHLTAMAPGDTYERVKLFMSYAPGAKTDDVPDPYYGEEAGFDTVLDLIESGSKGLLEAIQRDFL
ncbi:MAG: low molecular weight protein-tyrosine-phosphatase [Rhodospirillaceae bacterium]